MKKTARVEKKLTNKWGVLQENTSYRGCKNGKRLEEEETKK
jgi:hypothetical protein